MKLAEGALRPAGDEVWHGRKDTTQLEEASHATCSAGRHMDVSLNSLHHGSMK